MDFDRVLSPCIKGNEGNQLFIDSIGYTDSFGVRASCTINVNDVTFCVILPGEERRVGECKSMDTKVIIKYICSLYQGDDKPPACN